MRRRRYVGSGEVLQRGACAIKVRRARELRANPTHAEELLWEQLRRRQAGGWKFRRQHPVAGYIVDFFCPALDLAIEVDGPVHDDREREDMLRSNHLAQLGVAVVRFRNDDIIIAPVAVAREINSICERLAGAESRRGPPLSPEIGGKGPGDRGQAP